MVQSPVEKVIAAFGGLGEFCRATAIPTKRVRSWGAPIEQKGAGGRIPAKHQGEILKAARERDIALTAEDLIDMRDASGAFASEAEVTP